MREAAQMPEAHVRALSSRKHGVWCVGERVRATQSRRGGGGEGRTAMPSSSSSNDIISKTRGFPNRRAPSSPMRRASGSTSCGRA